MVETVNEPVLFEESDFADDQTPNEASPAVEEAKEQPTSQEEATTPTADPTNNNANEPEAGDEIEQFLAKKGVKLDDPDALRKVAEMYRNVEKDYGKKAQEKAQLERQIADLSRQPEPAGTPLQRIANIERQLQAERQIQAAREWKAAKNLSPEVEQKMVDYLAQPLIANGVRQMTPEGKPLTKYFLLEQGVLSLDEVYNSVGGDSFKADAIKQELKTAMQNEIAAKQAPKGGPSAATNSTQFTQPKQADDEFLAGLFG